MNASQPFQPLVSIVIPTYKRPDAVRRAALSALEQTWEQIEVFIISDGPDPETRAAVDGLDHRLRYMELPENMGPAAARNAGVQAAKGEWLTFLDDDDLMLPKKIETQMLLADPEKAHCMVSCRTIYRHGQREDTWPSAPIAPDEDIADYILLRPSLLARPGIVPLQSLLIHRSVLDRVQFSTHRDHEDWAWLLEAWHQAGARIVFAWAPLVVYNIHVDSMSRSRRLNWQESLEWAEQYRMWIGDRAFCSFLATKAALKARRAGDWRGLRQITGLVLRSRPGLLELLFTLGLWLLPEMVLQRFWRRSLRSAERQPSMQASGADALSVTADAAKFGSMERGNCP